MKAEGILDELFFMICSAVISISLHMLQNLRNLENRLDKAELKCKEAEHIHKTYLQIKKKLMDEQMTFDGNLDALQSEILK